jgi:integrase
MIVRLRWSKADQEGIGTVIPIEKAKDPSLCPVQAARDWLVTRGEEPGPLFQRTWWGVLRPSRMPAREVDAIVKRRAEEAGIRPEIPGSSWSAHSLRAGLITEAARAGRPEWQIMRHSRHKSYEVFRQYIRLANPFADNPASGLL